MKYILCAGALLLVLALSCCAVLWRIETLVGDLDTLLTLGADGDAQALWNAHKGFLYTVLRHSTVEEMDGHFAALPAQREALRSALRHLVEMEQAHYYNLL